MSKPNIQKVAAVDDRTLPVFAEFDKIAERIRNRAYELFTRHGFGAGNDVEDWLEAEREVCWPATELLEDDDTFELKVALAGFDADDITVTANPCELIVKATQEIRHEAPEESETSKVHWSEFRTGDVYRHVGLPVDIDVDKVSARFKRGLLTIEAPKAEETRKAPKHVEISTAA